MRRILGIFLVSATASLANGCAHSSAPAPSPPPATQATTGGDGHAHSHGAGPHGGTLTDWGGGAYHVEFTVDHERKEATVYILGSDGKSPAPIKTDKIQLMINDPMTEFELAAKPLDGETEGRSSRFVGTHETMGVVREFAGTISGQVEGTPYLGDFSEEPHAEDHPH